MEPLTEVLRRIPLFSACREDTLSFILQDARRTVLRGGEYLCRNGEPFSSLCVVLTGKLSVTADTGQGSAFLRTIAAPGLLGLSGLFGGGTAVSSAQARGKTELLLLTQESLERALRADPDFAVRYITLLTSRIRFLNLRIGTFTAGSAESRLGRYLLQSDPDGTGKVILPCPCSTLAEMLDLGRASLYRAFSLLEEEGLISRDGKTITVPDAAALAARIS